jgi:predicted RNA binding protein YcfA (HicA-like mRNA interferase family)
MSPKAPVITGQDLIRALRRAKFELKHVEGSHHILKRADGRTVSVPVHGSRTLKRGLLASILYDAGMTYDDLRNLL